MALSVTNKFLPRWPTIEPLSTYLDGLPLDLCVHTTYLDGLSSNLCVNTTYLYLWPTIEPFCTYLSNNLAKILTIASFEQR